MTHHDARLTRRAALEGAAALVIGFHLPLPAHAQSVAARSSQRAGGPAIFAPNAFIRIGTDNLVTVLIKHIRPGPVHGPRHSRRRGIGCRLGADACRTRSLESGSL